MSEKKLTQCGHCGILSANPGWCTPCAHAIAEIEGEFWDACLELSVTCESKEEERQEMKRLTVLHNKRLIAAGFGDHVS